MQWVITMGSLKPEVIMHFRGIHCSMQLCNKTCFIAVNQNLGVIRTLPGVSCFAIMQFIKFISTIIAMNYMVIHTELC